MTHTVTVEELEMAREMGFTNWLDNTPAGRGWFTCLLTGKKFRGQAAADMIAAQGKALAERTKEIEDQEQVEEIQAQEEAQEAAEEMALIEEIEAELAEPAAVVVPEIAVAEEGTPIRTGRLHTHIAVKIATDGKKPKTVIINCADCGAEREIKVQDQFQVTRCVGCQKKHRNRVRAARNKEKRAAAKAQLQE